jgi:hypothetical protein
VWSPFGGGGGRGKGKLTGGRSMWLGDEEALGGGWLSASPISRTGRQLEDGSSEVGCSAVTWRIKGPPLVAWRR